MNEKFLKKIKAYQQYLETKGIKNHIYRIERLEDGQMELAHYFDENPDFEDDFKLVCEAPEGTSIQDVIYLDDQDRWCMISLFRALMANRLIRVVTKNGSINYENLSQKDKENYDLAVEAIKQTYENPEYLSYEDSYRLRYYEKTMKGE